MRRTFLAVHPRALALGLWFLLGCGGDDGGVTPSGGSAGSSGDAVGGSAGSGGSAQTGDSSPTGGSTGRGDGASGSGGTSGDGGSGGSAGAAPSSDAAVEVGGPSGDVSDADPGGNPSICKFASGLNVAWVRFANDIPNPDLATFHTIFQNTHAAGGRIVRWWLHTNGTITPGYGQDGKALPIQQSHIDGIKAVLKAAHDVGIALDLSLWSFDMLQDNAGAAYTNNTLLLEKDDNRLAYINNYLTPMVKALRGTPGLYAYEIFNEPEGMGPKGWATHRTTEASIQKTVNWFADAIHASDPDVLVTNGSQTFDYCSNVSGKTNYYSDAALRTVGGKANGILDFYEVHYYTSNGVSNSAFKHPASYWGLDKKLVMGEFFAQDTDGVAQGDLMTYLYANGYQGAWAWAYTADRTWPTMQAPLQNLYKAHADVGNCPP